MLTRSSNLPHSFVGSTPDFGQSTEKHVRQSRCRLLRSESAKPALIVRIQDLAIDVELALFRGRVANSHRCRTLVTRQPRQLKLCQAPLTSDTVHNLSLCREPRHRAVQP